MSVVPPQTRAPDRRAQRRLESIEQVLATSIDVMAEAGVGGLSLGEVARRMGIRPPSLYEYFPSKNAIYDEVFAGGWRELADVVAGHVPTAADTATARKARAALHRGTAAFLRWVTEHPVQAQLMFWRPVPGFTPSEGAYAAAVATLESFASALRTIVDAGWLRRAAASEEGVRLFTVLTAGVITQHLANQPSTSYDDGVFTALAPVVTDMFFDHYTPRKPR